MLVFEKWLMDILDEPNNLPIRLTFFVVFELNKHYNRLMTYNWQQSDWVKYFVITILDAPKQARVLIDLTLKKTKFFDRFKERLNERQLKVIVKMFDAEPKGFEGGMTAKNISLLQVYQRQLLPEIYKYWQNWEFL